MACSGQPNAKALVIFPGALGDFVCFLPALDRLSLLGQVHLLAKSEFRELLPPWIAVESIERHEIGLAFVESAVPDPALRTFLDSYSSIYSWMGGSDANYQRNLRAASRAEVRCFPFRPKTTGVHISDYYLSCVGQNVESQTPSSLFPTPEAVLWAEDYWSRRGLHGKDVLGIAPGSGAREKNWPLESFKKIIEWWQQERGRVIVFTGPVEEENGLAGRFGGGVLEVRGGQLGRVAALLARCSLYVGNDSGVTHLAAALGVGTLAIFGPTNPVEWRPRGRNVSLLSLRAPCSPCDRASMKLCRHRMCLNDLLAEVVTSSIQKMSRSRGTHGRVHLDNI
jgi:ADP-heptose:LPS heptosyltransferase